MFEPPADPFEKGIDAWLCPFAILTTLPKRFNLRLGGICEWIFFLHLPRANVEGLAARPDGGGTDSVGGFYPRQRIATRLRVSVAISDLLASTVVYEERLSNTDRTEKDAAKGNQPSAPQFECGDINPHESS